MYKHAPARRRPPRPASGPTRQEVLAYICIIKATIYTTNLKVHKVQRRTQYQDAFDRRTYEPCLYPTCHILPPLPLYLSSSLPLRSLCTQSLLHGLTQLGYFGHIHLLGVCGPDLHGTDRTDTLILRLITRDERGVTTILLAIFYPPLKYIRGCVWLFLQAQKGTIYFTELA